MASPKVVQDQIEEPEDDDGFLTGKVTVRGRTYSFRELSTKTYDKLVGMATDQDDMVDRTLLLRIMIVESSVDPKLTADSLAELPYPVSRRLATLVNNMHYFDDEEKGEEGDSPNA
jgi:hypothetical protein